MVLNGFMIFSRENRSGVKDENPGIAITEVAKILGAMWRGLGDEEKAVYTQMGHDEAYGTVTSSEDDEDEGDGNDGDENDGSKDGEEGGDEVQ